MLFDDDSDFTSSLMLIPKDLNIPLDPKDPKSQAGVLARRFSDTIMSIQYGEVKHPWSVRID